MQFAHFKRNMRFERLRLRGLTGASDEFLLAATVQNLEAGQVDLAARSIDDDRSRRLAEHADPLGAAILILLRRNEQKKRPSDLNVEFFNSIGPQRTG